MSRVTAVLVAALCACGEDFVVRGDPTFPIPLSRDAKTGVPLTVAELGRKGDATARFPLVIDTGAPLSAMWPQIANAGADATALPQCARLDPIRLFTGDGSRARVAFEFHGTFRYLCTPAGQMGVGTNVTPIGGVLGGDVLSQFSVRFAPRAGPVDEPTVQFFEDLFERSEQLAVDGNVVLPFALAGGGTLIGADGVQRRFPKSRVVLRACGAPIAYDPVNGNALGEPPSNLGEDLATGGSLSLLLATGSPFTVLGRSSYERLAAAVASEPNGGRELTLTPPGPEDPLYLPGVTLKGTHEDKRSPLGAAVQGYVELGLLTLVARDRTSSDREKDPEVDACRELARARALTHFALHGGQAMLPRPITAHAELAGPRAAVVADDAPFLVSARLETGSRVSAIDGFLGADVLKLVEFEVAYPARDEEPSRVVLRCPQRPVGCVARARCSLERAKAKTCPETPMLISPPPPPD